VNVATVSLFLAILAVCAQAGVAIALVLAAGSRWSPTLAHAKAAVAEALGPQALALAFGVAAVAMAGSLYFSEVAHFAPCKLCWYQRIGMYPLVPTLGLAAWRRDTSVRLYSGVLAALGGTVSVYHVLLERFPSLESGACEITNPCTIIWVRRFGYVTIPTMALSAFALIVTLLAFAHPTDKGAH
jgi:disulfide bond formation protein DsbB